MNVKELLGKLNKQAKRQLGTVGVEVEQVERIPTGLFQFDLATGGGFAKGRVNLVYGPESSMKTTLCLKAIASSQKNCPDKICVFVDVEGHFDAGWAALHGVDVSTLAYTSPSSAEEMIDVVEQLLYADDIGVVVVDSLAAMVTTGELESSAEKAVVGNAGLAINKLYRKTGRAMIVAKDAGRTPTLILINQIRHKIGVMYGDPETMPGGSSFKFSASLIVRVYGKDEFDKNVSEALPAYKKVGIILKKWKMPIVSRTAEMMISLMPIPEYGLAVGESYDWNTCLSYMKKLDMLVKSSGGWDLIDLSTGEVLATYPTQDALKEKFYEDKEFGGMVKGRIISSVVTSGQTIDPE